MPDEPQNPTSEENSTPPSPQEPTEPALENTAHSEPSDAPPLAPEAPVDDFPVKSNDIPPSNSISTEAKNNQKTEEKSAQNEPEFELNSEPVSEPIQAIEPRTAQMAGNEPLAELEPEVIESKPSELKTETQKPTEALPPLAVKTFRNTTKEKLAKAQLTIQNKKRKKLDLILTLFAKQKNITNDEVEKLLHVSDATATRHLSQLEKEGRIKQNGKTGKGVSYSRI